VVQFDLLPPFGVVMEVKPGKRIGRHIKAHVIKPGKGSTLYGLDLVIGNEEVFLPTHENEILVLEIVSEIVIVEVLFQGFKRREFFPVLSVDVFVGVPLSREERVIGSDKFCIKESGNCRMIGC
jgi:hypothetical protein